MPDKIPFVLRITGTRGAIGKCYVIRYYKKYGYRMYRYPVWKKTTPTEAQKRCRNLFREAMDYAKWIQSNPQRKQAFLNTLTLNKRRWMPHRSMVKYYMKASVQLREKLKAKMQRSKEKLNVRLLNPFSHRPNHHQWHALWQKPTMQLLSYEYPQIKKNRNAESESNNSLSAHLFTIHH